ncbi:immunity protein Tsi6 family protein [Pseudoteredinibacter isoporae]|uniref:immunity protein Tsi6 family protein n=1 Tax=Pseudoteredinibacter isoporae TaxID=570281 RepID=UPI003102E4C8
MNPEAVIQKAVVQSDRLAIDYPNFQPLESVKAQLAYVKGILDGSIEDRSRLNEIIGIYAAKEFEERDMEFANTLYDVELIVDRLKSGGL